MSSKLKKLKHIIQEEIKLLKEQASKGIRIDVYKCEDSGYRQSWNNFCYNKESDMGPDIQIGDVFEIDQWPITQEPTRYFIKRISGTPCSNVIVQNPYPSPSGNCPNCCDQGTNIDDSGGGSNQPYGYKPQGACWEACKGAPVLHAIG